MNNNLALSINQSATRLFNSGKSGHLIGILAVFVPYLVPWLKNTTKAVSHWASRCLKAKEAPNEYT